MSGAMGSQRQPANPVWKVRTRIRIALGPSVLVISAVVVLRMLQIRVFRNTGVGTKAGGQDKARPGRIAATHVGIRNDCWTDDPYVAFN